MRKAGSSTVYELSTKVATDNLLFEYLLNNLRLADGFFLRDMQQAIGHDERELRALLTLPISQGLITLDSQRCRATPKGFRFLNEILLASLPKD